MDKDVIGIKTGCQWALQQGLADARAELHGFVAASMRQDQREFGIFVMTEAVQHPAYTLDAIGALVQKSDRRYTESTVIESES